MCSNGVAEFYSGKSVFITGGTGFLGKVLIEKLLYSCDKVDTIYVLVRGKKDIKAKNRISEITNNVGFSRIKQRNPKDLQKIVSIVGDLEEENLGVSSDNLETIIKNVSVVFHVAATVRFDEPLKKAVQININGTERVLKLCHRMKKLQALVHVSTMYSNTDREEVLEKVYPAPHSLEHVRYMAETYSDQEDIIKTLLGKRPNTYTYTKAIAEGMVQTLHGDIPTVIVRPSIVTAAHQEPLPGWIDNWNGPTRFVAGVAAGALRVVHGHGYGTGDFIPVDYVTNFIIVAGTKCEKSREVKVYNCCTSNSNPVAWQKQIDHVMVVTKKHRINEVPFPFAFYVKNSIVYQILVFFLHIVPALFMDAWDLLTRQKGGKTEMQIKVLRMMSILNYFTTNDWKFRDTNVRSELKTMSESDKKTFNFDVKTIDWQSYFSNYVFGVRKYLLKSKKKDEKMSF